MKKITKYKHQQRHARVKKLIEAGIDLVTMSKLIGHASFAHYTQAEIEAASVPVSFPLSELARPKQK